MPLYDYHCPTCRAWLPDQWFQLATEAPATRPCECGATLERMPGAPVMMAAWADRKPIDGFSNIFEGTKAAAAGHDGKNRVTYRSTKAQVDLGA